MSEMRFLIDQLNYHTKLYDEGKPEISDKQWDDMYWELLNKEKETGIVFPDSPTQKISYQVVNKLEKVTHNHLMLSLDKTKDYDEFLKYFSRLGPGAGYAIMLKLDGLTCCLTYEDGKLVSAETRGNGEVGENILHNALVIPSIPKEIPYKETLVIDGEIICLRDDFKDFEGEYKNSRNFASGSIRLLDSKECAKRKLTFVAWNVVRGLNNSFGDNLNQLFDMGFQIVPFYENSTTSKCRLEMPEIPYDVESGDENILNPHPLGINWYEILAKDYLAKYAEEKGYPIDGLVGRFLDRDYGNSLGATEHHARAAYAFKFYDETYEARLKYIEWSLGRTGVLTPVAVFEPIEINGNEITRASLHNYSVMKEIMGDCCYAGQKLEIFLANQIIPQVNSAEKMTYGEVVSRGGVTVDGLSGDLKCPVCGAFADLEKSDSGVLNYVCNNEYCDGKLLNKLEHMFGKKGLDIKGISKATYEKLMDWGWVEKPRDLFELHKYKDEWQRKPGFGAKSVLNILESINSHKECTLSQIIVCAGIPLVGSSASKVLAEKFKTWKDFRQAVDEDYKFYSINGFGTEIHYEIINFNYEEIDYIVEHYLTEKQPVEIKVDTSGALNGKTICITGKLLTFKNRAALEDAIKAAGGKTSTSVSKNTSILINNDINSNSSKNVTAKKLNIPIMTELDFKDKFLTK